MMAQEQLMEVQEIYREGHSDGGKALKFRCFITKENYKDFQIVTTLLKNFKQKKLMKKFQT